MLNMTRYWDHCGDFSICEDLLLIGGRLVMPSLLCKGLLHDGYQGVNRCLALAKDSVWWPDLKSQAKTTVENSTAWASTSVQRCEPTLATETPSAPWERVAADLFYLDGQDFLLIVDCRLGTLRS